MIRGIERRNIFRNNKDREDFIARLKILCPQTETNCYAWSLLPNHAHLLLRTGSEPLSRLMRRLLTGYVIGFNRRHRRSGQLFQNRFKSIICQEETYLRELVRYIHLNPIRAGIVQDHDVKGSKGVKSALDFCPMICYPHFHVTSFKDRVSGRLVPCHESRQAGGKHLY